jgi:hypothetical protein
MNQGRQLRDVARWYDFPACRCSIPNRDKICEEFYQRESGLTQLTSILTSSNENG